MRSVCRRKPDAQPPAKDLLTVDDSSIESVKKKTRRRISNIVDPPVVKVKPQEQPTTPVGQPSMKALPRHLSSVKMLVRKGSPSLLVVVHGVVII